MNFGLHPSEELVRLFREKPYQGQDPKKASVIFLSSDANYSPEISEHQFFEYILEYHQDGVGFWRRHGSHHPFMLPDYPLHKGKGGRPFHQRFSKMGLGSECAEHISFVELLDVPTIGNKSQNRTEFFSLISFGHLSYLDTLIAGGGGKLFLIPGGVLRDMHKLRKKYSVFSWLDYKQGQSTKYRELINGNEVREIYHFSSSQIFAELPTLSQAIHSWVNKVENES